MIILAQNIWILWCLAAIFFTGLRGYYRKKIATQIKSHQHLHLISTTVTMFLAAIYVFKAKTIIPAETGYFIMLCLINGVAYALAGVCNYRSVKYLKLTVFQSASKLSAFLPVIVFWLILEERISTVQMAGILLSSFPIMLLSFAEKGTASNGKKEDRQKILTGIIFLIIYIIVTSSQQIINVLVVSDKFGLSLGADPIFFVMCSNLLSAPFLALMIIKKKERAKINPILLRSGTTAGIINTAAFASYLMAIKLGPASSVVPMYSYNAFVSVALLKAFPLDKSASTSRRKKAILLFLVAWGIVSFFLLIKGA